MPCFGLFYYLPAQTLWYLGVSLCLGTPILILIGAMGAALTVSLGNSAILLALLILPLYIPVLIFGASLVHNALLHLPLVMPGAMLVAMLSLAITCLPWVIIQCLRLGYLAS
jgi:heme exporter protein B